jgi:hypothetical protein
LFPPHPSVYGCLGVLAFVIRRPHNLSLADGDPGTLGASVQRLVLGIFLRFGSLPKTKRKFLRSRFALWTASPQSRAGESHRQRSCGRTTKEKNTMSKSSKPVAKLSMYPITAAIWVNERDGKSYYSVTIERTYKDDAGIWKNTSTFNAGDLLLVAKVADLAHTEIAKIRAADNQSQPSDE